MVAEVLKKLKGVSVAVVGDVVVDRYTYGTVNRMSREAPVAIVDEERVELRPGGAANAAVNIAALGASATLLGVVGGDRAAEAFQIAMKDRGVSLQLTVEAGRETAQKVRVMAASLGTRHQQVLRIDRTPRRPPTPVSVDHVISQLRRLTRTRCRSVLVSDYGQGLLTDAFTEAIKRLAENGCSVIVDSRYALHAARGPVILKPNAAELEQLVGRPVESTADTIDACRALVTERKLRAIVATRGRQGMVVVTAERKIAVVPMHGTAEVTDVTGAGDTVAAVLAAAVAAGVTLARAAQLASIAASIVVGKVGSAVATPSEIRRAGRPRGLKLETWRPGVA